VLPLASAVWLGSVRVRPPFVNFMAQLAPGVVLQTDCSWLGYGLPLKSGLWLLINVPLGMAGGGPVVVGELGDVCVVLPVSFVVLPVLVVVGDDVLAPVLLLAPDEAVAGALVFEVGLLADDDVLEMTALFATALWKMWVIFVSSRMSMTTKMPPIISKLSGKGRSKREWFCFLFFE